MLTFNGNLKVYVAIEPCDMRKSFNGFSEIARSGPGPDPLCGAALVFTNRRRTLIKIVYWDGAGYWCLAKRLGRGNFRWPKDIAGDRKKILLKPAAPAMLTGGIDLRDGLRGTWCEND